MQAWLDAAKLVSAGLWEKARIPLIILADNPYYNPRRGEKLIGDLAGYYSRRINIQHRLVYQILSETRAVKILRMRSHYE